MRSHSFHILFLKLVGLAIGVAVMSRPAHAVLDIDDRGPVLNAGGFALRITNAGIIGNAFFDKGLSFDPSFEIPPGSGLEALHHAELWVGGEDANGAPRVSGGPMLEWRPTLDPSDRVTRLDHGTPGTLRRVDDDGDGQIDEEIPNGKDDDGDGEVDEDLGIFAQQVLFADYVDDRPEALSTISEGGELHEPLGLSVHQEAYAWSTPGYEGIAGLSFHVTNHGSRPIRNVYMGLFADLDSRAQNDRGGHLNDRIEYQGYSRTTMEGLYALSIGGHCQTGTTDLPPCGFSVCTATLSQTLPVLVDGFDPHLPAVAVVPLRHTTDPLGLIPPVARYARAPTTVSFRTSIFARGRIPGQGGLPPADRDRYEALRGAYPSATTETLDDYSVLVSCGPFPMLLPGQSLDFDVALVATLDRDSLAALMGNAAVLNHGFTEDVVPDSLPLRNADEWYNGISGFQGHEACIEAPPGITFEWDPHCAGKFGPDAGAQPILTLYNPGQCIWTDADCDICTGIGGRETRFYWADPGERPIAPTVRVRSGDHRIVIEWDNRPELLIAAGITGLPGSHFAGYRVYKLADWRRRVSLLPPRESWALWNAFGFHAENGERLLSTVTDTTLDFERFLYRGKLYPIGRYAVADTEVQNGFDYAYVVSTIMERDIDAGSGRFRAERVESPFVPIFQQIIQPHAAARPRTGDVWVVPNPFRASEAWQRPPVLDDPLTRHLDFMGLPRARAVIRIFTLAGDFVAAIDHDGTGGDGEAAWDLVSRNGQEVASGIYLFTVDSTLGRQVGRFVVMR